MREQRIKYVRKTENHQRITHVGSDDWASSVEDMMREIMAPGGPTYYTLDANGTRADVEVVDGETGRYPRSNKDGSELNNLDSLPDFPFFPGGTRCTIAGRYVSTNSPDARITMAVGAFFVSTSIDGSLAEWKLVFFP